MHLLKRYRGEGRVNNHLVRWRRDGGMNIDYTSRVYTVFMNVESSVLLCIT
jgi:hypothetical protein